MKTKKPSDTTVKKVKYTPDYIALNKEFAGSGIVIGDNRNLLSVSDGLSSGSYMLNKLLTDKVDIGFPKGKIIEISGENATGKSTLAAHTCISAQEKNIPQFWNDAETNFETQAEYFQTFGLDIDNLPRTDPETPMFMEDFLNLCEKFLLSGAIIIVDSVPALTPKKQAEKDFGGGYQTMRAALLAESLPILRTYARRGGGIMILLNQLRDDLKNGGKKTSGGTAIPYYADARIQLFSWRQNDVKGKGTMKSLEALDSANVKISHDEVIATNVLFKITKNKFNKPFRTGYLYMEYGKGIERKHDILYLAEYCGLVDKVTDKQYTYKGKLQAIEKAEEDFLQHLLKESDKIKLVK